VNAVDCVGRAKIDRKKNLSVCIGQESFNDRSQILRACNGFGTVNGVSFPHEFDADNVDIVEGLSI
jgi:hypothetical protein